MVLAIFTKQSSYVNVSSKSSLISINHQIDWVTIPKVVVLLVAKNYHDYDTVIIKKIMLND